MGITAPNARMPSVHAFIILSGLILPSFILGQNCPFIECPSGWKMWRRGCYRFTSDLSWADAKQSCQAMGGEMAAPRSREENDFFFSYITEKNPNWGDLWIACDDLDAEGQWMCNNMQQTNTFTYWGSGEPNNFGIEEDCGTIHKYLKGKWADMPCTYEVPAICYRKPIH